MPAADCQELLQNTLDTFEETEPLLKENGQYERIGDYRKLITRLKHFGCYSIEFPDQQQERQAYANLLKKVIQKVDDKRLTRIVDTLKDLDGAGALPPDRLGLTMSQRRALVEHDGKKVQITDKGELKDVRIIVEKDPIQFTPGSAWQTYQKFFPLLAAFTPYACGPTNDTATQSRAGRVMQPLLGLLLSPLLLIGSLLFLLIGGPAWHSDKPSQPLEI